MKILYGKEVENHLSKTITEKLNLLREKNRIPKLAILRVGKNGNDISYEKSLKKKLNSFKIPYTAYEYRENIEAEKTVPEREGYTKRVAYKVVTYGGLAVLVIPAVDLIARLDRKRHV